MITEFLSSWPVFGPVYLTAIAGAVLLSVVGVLVVARDQVFLAAAVSQSSLLGVAAALFLGRGNPAIVSTAFSVGAAVMINLTSRRRGITHQEATGWVFLLGSAVAVLLLVHQPYSLRELQALTASSLIGATGSDAMLAGGAGVALLVGTHLVRSRLVLWLTDPVMAAAVGMPIGRWSLATAIGLGLAAGLMLRVTGLLFTFGTLVLPALTAKCLTTETGKLFWLSPVVAVLGVGPGLVLAHHWDLPPGQVAVVTLAVLAVIGAGYRSVRERLMTG